MCFLKLAPELELPHIWFSFDFWAQIVASNCGNQTPQNSCLQVDVKPTSPFIHPHTFSVLVFTHLFIDCYENKQELHALRALHYCLVEKTTIATIKNMLSQVSSRIGVATYLVFL